MQLCLTPLCACWCDVQYMDWVAAPPGTPVRDLGGATRAQPSCLPAPSAVRSQHDGVLICRVTQQYCASLLQLEDIVARYPCDSS